MKIDRKKFCGIVMLQNIDTGLQRPALQTIIDRSFALFKALYWDKVLCQTDLMFGGGFNASKILVDDGILEHPALNLGSGVRSPAELAHARARSQLADYERRDAELPGHWAMGQVPLAEMISVKEFAADRELLIGLYGALLASAPETPIDQALESKRKRFP